MAGKRKFKTDHPDPIVRELETVRQQLGGSQREMAESIGVPFRTYQKWVYAGQTPRHGAALVSRQGRAEMAALQASIGQGAVPTKELAHGAMILVAGAVLLTPGFLTDAVGFALLVPQIREFVRRWFSRRYGRGPITIQ